MKKTLILIVFMLINLITPAYADQAAQVKQRVEFIYNTVLPAYNKAAKENYNLNSMPDFDEKFCSQNFNRNMNKIAKLEETSEGPLIGADYWVMGQDFTDKLHIKDVKVVSISGNKATVELKLYNFDYSPITVKMVFERGDWFIDNFINESKEWHWDLQENMKEVMKEYSKSN